MGRILCLLLLSLSPLIAADKYLVTVRLHAEGNSKGGDSFVAEIQLFNPQKKIFIEKVPIISEKDVVAFYPFPAQDNSGSIGAYFQLDANGTNKLEQHTTASRDTLDVVLINGRVGPAMQVDKKIKDGLLMVPTGFSPLEITQLQTKFPIIGKEKEFATQKKNAMTILKESERQKAAEAKEEAKKKNQKVISQ
ncbi:hypothetical protein TSACC_2344 [Terrimicrobium sacchariphilum]|uniref:Uncharacterized protein n=1 Tax=Terrimicrobium sacchariphilum TaxID=690879 RepID=A0A146G255_TERSA|nr:hypothetical protein [Terrimicrobium sacchariphilum]GAT31949.1 hypothetical protein TSACC_2344 [Terrimicrobium sacchariphilum]